MRRAVFFDRDGVLNHDSGYLFRPLDFVWIEGAKDAILKAKQLGFITVLVTNQSGIARGYYSEDDFHSLCEWMNVQLAEIGASLDAIYYCPHLPDGGVAEYSVDCDCRKPKPGMLLQAILDHSIDPAHSFLVGDSPRDIEAAKSAGVQGYLFPGGNLLDFLNQANAWEVRPS